MGVRHHTRKVQKLRGRRKTPRRALVLRFLQRMPEKYASVKEHSLLCEIAAGEIAKQLRARGLKIDPRFVSRAALAHDAFKQFGEIIKETPIAKNYFMRKGFPEFAESLSATHALQKLSKSKLDKLSLIKKIIIYCDNVCRGVPKTGRGKIVRWENDIYSVKDAWETVKKRLEKGQMHGSNVREFFLTKIIERELIGMGLDPEKLRRKTRRQFRAL